MFDHSVAYGSDYKQGRVIDIKINGYIKDVICEDVTYKAKAIIIATGTKERKNRNTW